ncbi:MAG: ABC transporter ATP-binding protein [Bdellovibrionota bacterium]|nr:ABC transporter ATP-binding protein [Bdellovibrionota bacterium]
MPELSNAISIQNVYKSYGGVEAVQRCSFNVTGGTITGVIGPNGAGKSTLFNILAGLIKADGGDILLGNKYVTGFAPYKMAEMGLMRTFQVAHEYPRMTVLENLKVAPRKQLGLSLFSNWVKWPKIQEEEKKWEEKAIEVLQTLELDHLKGELAGNLSGGQKKLLEFGRILMGEPKIVLLDEISAGISPLLMQKIVGLIQQINKENDVTFCVIEHNMELIKQLCNPIIVMVNGEVLVKGTFEEVISNPDVIEAYLGIRAWD